MQVFRQYFPKKIAAFTQALAFRKLEETGWIVNKNVPDFGSIYMIGSDTRLSWEKDKMTAVPWF